MACLCVLCVAGSSCQLARGCIRKLSQHPFIFAASAVCLWVYLAAVSLMAELERQRGKTCTIRWSSLIVNSLLVPTSAGSHWLGIKEPPSFSMLMDQQWARNDYMNTTNGWKGPEAPLSAFSKLVSGDSFLRSKPQPVSLAEGPRYNSRDYDCGDKSHIGTVFAANYGAILPAFAADGCVKELCFGQLLNNVYLCMHLCMHG